MQHLSLLSNLRILSVQSNRLTKIQGLESLRNLQELHIADNSLTELSGLDGNDALRIIDISRNQITTLENIRHLVRLEEFWASSNLFDSFDEIRVELGNKEHLDTVYFEGNPVQTKNPTTYRNKVRFSLPHIKQIDASECCFRSIQSAAS